MFQTLIALFMLANLMVTGQTTTVRNSEIQPSPVIAPTATQSTPKTTVTQGQFELKEMAADQTTDQFGPPTTQPAAQTENQFATADSPWQPTGLTSKYIVSAIVEKNPTSTSYYVMITFNPEGAKLFEEITARNIGKPVAIFVDGVLISAPTVNEKISGGQAQIVGNYSLEEAQQLANQLNAGIGTGQ
jgi:preprotein translocase subunit SecD